MTQQQTGRVTFVNNKEGWGFLVTPSYQKVHFHQNHGPEDNNQMPKVGDALVFNIKEGNNGLKASEWTWEGRELKPSVPMWNGNVPSVTYFFKQNLERFKLADIVVTGYIGVRRRHSDGYTKMFHVRVGPMRLSEMCGDVYSTIDRIREDDMVTRQIVVFKDGVSIGYILDNLFLFVREKANDLRDVLGWALVTGHGQATIVHCNLDVITENLKSIESYEEFSNAFYRTFFYNDEGRRVLVVTGISPIMLWSVINNRCFAA